MAREGGGQMSADFMSVYTLKDIEGLPFFGMSFLKWHCVQYKWFKMRDLELLPGRRWLPIYKRLDQHVAYSRAFRRFLTTLRSLESTVL